MPKDWLDASGGEEKVSHVVWLVRGDYGASITIDEINLDDRSRSLLEKEGVESVAPVVKALHGGSGSNSVRRTPGILRINDLDCVSFEQDNEVSGDISRIVIFAARGRLYEAIALCPATRADEIFSVQQRFLEALKW